jgi:hypothetical protein
MFTEMRLVKREVHSYTPCRGELLSRRSAGAATALKALLFFMVLGTPAG